MRTLDWAVVALYITALGAYSLWLARKKQAQSLDQFFVAGRSLPWWVAGTSMVAATFSADTPLAVTGFVAQDGVAGNWLWWNMGLCHLAAAIFFSRMWRKSGVTTDASLIALRYHGKPAEVLRTAKAFYFAVPVNALVIGWSMLAMTKIAAVLFDPTVLLGADRLTTLRDLWPLPGDAVGGLTAAVCVALVAAYALPGGLAAMSRTGFAQFGLALLGAILLAVYAVQHVGGLTAIPQKLALLYPDRSYIHLIPDADSVLLPFSTFLTYVGVLWWAQKYSDGGGLIIQRMASAKNEREAFYATAWFCFAHYVLRSWPWILAALAALIVFPLDEHPNLDREASYVALAQTVLPQGLLGLMAVSLMAAFMSTIDAQLNWGASYLVSDIYRPLIHRDASERELLFASRLAMIALMALSVITMAQMQTVGAAWKFLLAIGSGLGLVTLARWFWWRVNAFSELAALVASTLIGLALTAASTPTLFGTANPLYVGKLSFEATLYPTLVGSTLVWLTVTLLTRPEPTETLTRFYTTVAPPGPGWNRIRAQISPGDTSPHRGTALPLIARFAAAIIALYGALFGLGDLFLASTPRGIALLIVAAIAATFALRQSPDRDTSTHNTNTSQTHTPG